MKVVVAPNAFKGSLSADEAAKAIAAGLCRSWDEIRCSLKPVADGGDGTGSLLAHYLHAERINGKTEDPLGRMINADYWYNKVTRTAIIELAEASGLKKLTTDERVPLMASTYGTGILIAHAIGLGAKEIVVGMGGSATTDGGAGILAALGARFLDEQGNALVARPKDLLAMTELSIAGLPLNENVHITVLCDVRNPLLGPEGSVAVFGRQKGADAVAMDLLTSFLSSFNRLQSKFTGTDLADMPGAGAAGGAAGFLHAILRADLVPGTSYFINKCGLEEDIKGADLVITGEGSLDEQTLKGKGPEGVATLARKHGVPLICLAGRVQGGQSDAFRSLFPVVFPIGNGYSSQEEAMRNTAGDLERTAFNIGTLLKSHSK